MAVTVIKNIIKKYCKSLFYFYYYNINKFLFYLKNVNIKKDYNIKGILYIKNKGTIKINNNFRANSGKMYNPIGGDTVLRLIVQQNGILEIGKNVGISNSSIVCTNHISIGNNVLIGGGCKIWDTDFHALDPYIRIIEKDRVVNSKSITIHDNVFIGSQSLILKGVSVGKNSIIGAGSVVTRSIPENEIWAGNPAKFIKKVDIKNEF